MGNEREKLEIKELMKIIRKRHKIITFATSISIILGLILVSFVIKPTYEAKTSIIIGNSVTGNNTKLQYDDLILYQNLVKTYSSIVKTTIVAEKVIDSLKLNMTVEDLEKKITATPEEDTQILSISVEDSSPKEAVDIINAVNKAFIEEANDIYPESNIKIMDKIKMPDKPVAPDKKLYVGISAFLGILISGILVMISEYIDNTIKTETDVEEYLDLHVIGNVPLESDDTKFSSHTVEAFRTLRTNIDFASIDNKVKTIMITSSRSGEGKTVTAKMLGAAMAQNGKKTILVDCDLRKPKLHTIFNLANSRGLSNMLAAGIKLSDVGCKTNIENLDILCAGVKPPNPAELLSSSRMKEFMGLLREEYDCIILDTPPVGLVSDAQILSVYADGCILVVASGESVKENCIKAKNLLKFANAKILGVCLNKIKELNEKSYGGYYANDETENRNRKVFKIFCNKS